MRRRCYPTPHPQRRVFFHRCTDDDHERPPPVRVTRLLHRMAAMPGRVCSPTEVAVVEDEVVRTPPRWEYWVGGLVVLLVLAAPVWAVVVYNTPYGLPRTIVGPGCPADRGGGREALAGPDGDGWQRAGGGYTGHGCSGDVLLSRVSGAATGTDSFVWRFRPGGGNTTCSVRVHVPGPAASLGPAVYLLRGGVAERPPVRIDQAAHRGAWVMLVTVPVRGEDPALELVLTDAGEGDHAVAADAAFTDCNGAPPA
ncbi:hypothetical protein AB0K00_33335 [Dactylosporangium sp. NPDC049525]|uniref:hypothetical protein n=1 Tax=Dactylosporangium sp. NPDC049525 TaxID=3154730 RepID=UPI003416D6D4